MYKTIGRNVNRNGRECRLDDHYDKGLAARLRRERHEDLVRRFGKNYAKGK